MTSTAAASVTVHVTGATASRVFYLSIKYTPKSLIGSPPNPTTATYTFNTAGVLGSSSQMKAVKK